MSELTSWADIVTQGGALGLAILFLWLFATGRIVPRKSLDEIRLDRDNSLGHKDEEVGWWREAYKLQAERSAKQEEALRECLEVGRATLHALEALGRVKRELE